MISSSFLYTSSPGGSGAEQDYILGSRAPTDSCNDINNCRRLFDIVWGCATTIFAANLALLWRRLKMMLVAVIAPEVMVGFAARQLIRDLENTRFFVCMGGFVTRGKHPIVERRQLRIYASAIKEIQVGAIKDKSKGDALSKAVALFQGLWFITQCIARATQHLPLTETRSCDTCICRLSTFFIWLLWWGKPLDVQDPNHAWFISTLIRSRATQSRLRILIPPLSSNSVPSFFFRILSGQQLQRTCQDPFCFGILCWRHFWCHPLCRLELTLPSANEKWMWRSGTLLVTAVSLIAVLEILYYYYSPEPKYFKVAFVAFIPLYIIARLFLLIIPFTSLRTLPPDALSM
ncbi:hypothetical protein B0H14DRAFT_2690425 [Mycena olivaceomarginata]|nr:hypothetical protein B0H14DRAFT_2690425 [Mycena olivaceomarginata]